MFKHISTFSVPIDYILLNQAYAYYLDYTSEDGVDHDDMLSKLYQLWVNSIANDVLFRFIEDPGNYDDGISFSAPVFYIFIKDDPDTLVYDFIMQVDDFLHFLSCPDLNANYNKLLDWETMSLSTASSPFLYKLFKGV